MSTQPENSNNSDDQPFFFVKHLDRFLDLCNAAFENLIKYIFHSDGDAWAGRFFLAVGVTLLVMVASHLQNCANNYHAEEALKLQACEKAGMAYLEHSQHGNYACLTKTGEVLVVDTRFSEDKVKVIRISGK